jgi:Txe/YoeB family toxin of Txe-Axe toxin-antitoxin module
MTATSLFGKKIKNENFNTICVFSYSPKPGPTVPIKVVDDIHQMKSMDDKDVYDAIDDIYSEITGTLHPPQNNYEKLRRPTEIRASRLIDTQHRPISLHPPNGNEYVETIQVDGNGAHAESKVSSGEQQVTLQANDQNFGVYLTVA